MSDSIIYSVIIPHRDSLQLLERAVHSIPDESHIEIIVVDNSLKFIDFSPLISSRANLNVLFSAPKRGAGGARNVGLAQATGQWYLFLDADDFYVKNAFNLFDQYKDSDCDIIFFKVTSCYSDTLEYSDRAAPYSAKIINHINRLPRAEDILRFGFNVPWGKMYSSDLIKGENILFDEVIASNDVMFSIQAGHFARKIESVDSEAYCVTVCRGSLTNIRSYEVLKSRYVVALRANKFLKNNGHQKHQLSVMYFLVGSLKYGLKPFFEFIFLAVKYKNNIFIGCYRWFRTIFAILANKSDKKDYIEKQ